MWTESESQSNNITSQGRLITLKYETKNCGSIYDLCLMTRSTKTHSLTISQKRSKYDSLYGPCNKPIIIIRRFPYTRVVGHSYTQFFSSRINSSLRVIADSRFCLKKDFVRVWIGNVFREEQQLPNSPPFSLPQHSTEAAILFVDKKHFVSLDELKFAISSGSTFIFSSVAGHPPPFPDPLFLITISFPYSPLHNHPDMPPGSPLALLRRTVKGPRVSISPLMQRISRTDPFPCQKAHNTNGLSPLHLVVLIGSVVVLEEFLEKAPLFFSSLTRSKETVFHLAARNKNVDGFIFMAERLGINSQKLLQQVDVNGNTVLHIAVSMACGAPGPCGVPFAFQEAEAMLYRETVEDEVVHLRNSFSMLEEACTELKSSRLFLKLLKVVLRTGNKMNVGTILGGAKAFKLSNVKCTYEKTTLFHFVVKEISRSKGIRV
ncbi:unnamed protein product [Brassica oleracea var. botrytis]